MEMKFNSAHYRLFAPMLADTPDHNIEIATKALVQTGEEVFAILTASVGKRKITNDAACEYNAKKGNK